MNFNGLVEALKSSSVYGVSKVDFKSTHISCIFLTGEYAYKIKKPVDFGFLNFSSLEKRKHFCEEEIRLNSRLSPSIYLGLVKITEKNGKVFLDGDGEVIEYAVKMKQIPEESVMGVFLKQGKISRGVIDKIAKIVADFHLSLEGIHDKYGSFDIIKMTWDENFEQTLPFVGKVVNQDDFNFVKDNVGSFMEDNKEFFAKRINNNRVKYCHGDLHSGNIFIHDDIYIFDCIEFNKRISCTDVVADVAFMIMDLEFHNKHDLAEEFKSKYFGYTNDEEGLRLLNFYKCYRAYVRFKIACLTSVSDTLTEEEKKNKVEEAKKYFDLSYEYAKNL